MKKQLLTVFAAFAFAYPAHAQSVPPSIDGFWINAMGMINFSSMMQDQFLGDAPPSTGNTRTSNKPTSQIAFAYSPSSQISAQVRQQFANQLVRAADANGEQAQQLRQTVEQSLSPKQLTKVAQGLFANEKFVITDISDTTAMLVIGCFFVVQGMQRGTLEQNLAVRNQFRTAFSLTPAIVRMTDAQKQRHAEGSMILLATLLHEYQQLQQGAPGYTRERVEGFSRQLLLSMGIDSERWRLGNQGLERQ